jgi:hypothetical protein
MAFISPLPVDKIAHLQLLLELAEDVNDVQTTMDGPTGLAFNVPDELAERYLAALKVPAGEDTGDAPVKRKPGRPKKNTDG